MDYLYIGITNGLAFSPTDAMPLAAWAKLTMAVQAFISFVVLGLVIAVSAYRSRHLPSPARGLGLLIGLAVVVQLALGIATLMSGVPVWLGVLHQLGAVAAMTAATAFAWRVRRV